MVTAVQFWNGGEALFIRYSSVEYVRFALKIALTWKELSRVIENIKIFNRLRSGNLEKTAIPGICRLSRSPLTAKISSRVHIRLRSQNLEQPRVAGLCGRKEVASDHLPLSLY